MMFRTLLFAATCVGFLFAGICAAQRVTDSAEKDVVRLKQEQIKHLIDRERRTAALVDAGLLEHDQLLVARLDALTVKVRHSSDDTARKSALGDTRRITKELLEFKEARLKAFGEAARHRTQLTEMDSLETLRLKAKLAEIELQLLGI